MESGKERFNRQALLMAVGLILFFLSLLFAGESRSSEYEREIGRLLAKIEAAEEEIAKLSNGHGNQEEKINSLSRELRGMRQEARNLEIPQTNP